MNGDWFGDSYDIVKRFFIGVIHSLDYEVYVDPLATGEWATIETDFLKFLDAKHVRDVGVSERSALFLDPDTGIGVKHSIRHTTIESISDKLDEFAIVLVFDQSLDRGKPSLPQLQRKLQHLRDQGAYGFYYDSHARFLFSSRSQHDINLLHKALLQTGLPGHRLVVLSP